LTPDVEKPLPSRRIRLPGALTSRDLQRHAVAAHGWLDSYGAVAGNAFSGAVPDSLRVVIRESWERSMRHLPNPDSAGASLVFNDEELEEYRRGHPLASIMPVIHRLLVQPSYDSGLLVAVGDEFGRLLWVDGDPQLRRRAEGMMFVPGADWSEARVGTSAPGTALALNRGVQIAGAEHFNRTVHPWSCTAVPFHDPDSGAVLGVVDITGTETAVAPHTLSLVEATVAAAEAQLRVERLQLAATQPRGLRRKASGTVALKQRDALHSQTLQTLGRDRALLSLEGRNTELSARHSELLTLLALNPDGLSAEALCLKIYPVKASAITLRAEMVRLRQTLLRLSPDSVPASRPYRLPMELVVDAGQVLTYLKRGAHRMALEIYRGPVLPHSEAPAIVDLRTEVSVLLREAILTDASAEVVLRYAQLPEAADDVEVWQACAKLLPARSPKRAAVVMHLEKLRVESAS
jgi:hypothetical protein